MKISKQARREAKELFRSCLANGLLGENGVRQAVQAVVAQKPRGYVAILSHFQRLVKLDLDRRTARVESAAPLSPDIQAAVQSNLGRKYGPGLNVSFAQNPTLIARMPIQLPPPFYSPPPPPHTPAFRDT